MIKTCQIESKVVDFCVWSQTSASPRKRRRSKISKTNQVITRPLISRTLVEIVFLVTSWGSVEFFTFLILFKVFFVTQIRNFFSLEEIKTTTATTRTYETASILASRKKTGLRDLTWGRGRIRALLYIVLWRELIQPFNTYEWSRQNLSSKW